MSLLFKEWEDTSDKLSPPGSRRTRVLTSQRSATERQRGKEDIATQLGTGVETAERAGGRITRSSTMATRVMVSSKIRSWAIFLAYLRGLTTMFLILGHKSFFSQEYDWNVESGNLRFCQHNLGQIFLGCSEGSLVEEWINSCVIFFERKCQ